MVTWYNQFGGNDAIQPDTNHLPSLGIAIDGTAYIQFNIVSVLDTGYTVNSLLTNNTDASVFTLWEATLESRGSWGNSVYDRVGSYDATGWWATIDTVASATWFIPGNSWDSAVIWNTTSNDNVLGNYVFSRDAQNAVIRFKNVERARITTATPTVGTNRNFYLGFITDSQPCSAATREFLMFRRGIEYLGDVDRAKIEAWQASQLPQGTAPTFITQPAFWQSSFLAGENISWDQGTTNGTTPITLTDSQFLNTTAVSNSSGSYRLLPADIGANITLTETATNSFGSCITNISANTALWSYSYFSGNLDQIAYIPDSPNSTAFNATGDILVPAGINAIYNGAISGNGTVTFSGGGNLTVTADQKWNGDTVLNEGTFGVVTYGPGDADNRLGNTSVYVEPNATFKTILQADAYLRYPILVLDGGKHVIEQAGNAFLGWYKPIVVNADSRIEVVGGSGGPSSWQAVAWHDIQGTGNLEIVGVNNNNSGVALARNPSEPILSNYSGALTVQSTQLILASTDGTDGRWLENAGLNLSNATLTLSASTPGLNTPVSTTVRTVTGDSASTIYLGNQTLTIKSPANTSTVFAGLLTGAGGSLTKNGAGNLTLTANNTYTGSTNVSNGSLQFNGLSSATNISGTGTVILNSNTYGSATFTSGFTGLIDVSATSLGINNGIYIPYFVNNKGSLNVRSGCIVQIAANTPKFDAITGSGTIQNSAGGTYAPATLTVGINNGSGTFSGNLVSSS
ncbi:MAG: autotransporter-associated beta strand repeat-containing protein, partial [Serratia fonticola]